MPPSSPRSVITCDLEGRIETFNHGAEAIFGYTPEEVIRKKRVSMFSPGVIVLRHLPRWLKTARELGEHSTRTVLIRRDGTHFAARLKITPTYAKVNGERVHVGYCGLTEPLADTPVEAVMPGVDLASRALALVVVTRLPFLTATLAPMLIGAAWTASHHRPEPFPWLLLAAALIAASLLHVSANTFNDYFDWTLGVDELNNDYFTPYSGGSRCIELGLISERGLWWVGLATLLAAAAAASPVIVAQGSGVILFGLAGAFLAYFYTAPPLRLSARKGLGELSVGLAFGPLLLAGTVFALTGEIGYADFAVGVPIGLLTTAILWVNEIPDAPADAAAGKRHLVVVLSPRATRWGFCGLVTLGFVACVALAVTGLLPVTALLVLGALPLAVYAVGVVFTHFEDRQLVRASRATIGLHLSFGILMAVGIAYGSLAG